MRTPPALDIDTLPAERFVKAGKYACIRQEENPRETLCDATGYTLAPEFREPTHPHHVSHYCDECQEKYRKETGNFANSADDTHVC